MMPNKTWKDLERKVAKMLGGQRIAASGNGGIKGDVQHDTYFIECKWGKQIPKTVLKWHEWMKEDKSIEIQLYEYDVPKTILNWYKKAKQQSEKKKTILIMKPKGIHEEFVFYELIIDTETTVGHYYIFTTLNAFAEQHHKIHGKEVK